MLTKLKAVAAAIFLLAAPAAADQADDYAGPRLFIFGDSLSDNGNLFLATDGAFPDPSVYSWGRASNGPTWSERLGWYLGNAPDVAQIQAPWDGFGPYQQGYNFAHFGATVLDSAARPGQRLSVQTGYFSRPDALITRFRASDKIAIWAGANDYLAFGATDTNLITSTLAGHVRTLGRAGGQNMLVLNQPLWGNTPVGYERGDRSALNTLMRAHNTALSTQVANLRRIDRLDAYYINIAALYTDIYVNPSVYGFSVVRPGAATRGHCLGDGYGLSTCPSTYAFYDAVHPSDSLHAVLGAYIASQYASIDARKTDGAVISQSSANTLALQAAIGMGRSVTGAGFAGADFDFGGGASLFAFSDAASSDTNAFLSALNDASAGEGFSLVGGRVPLTSNLSVTAGFSKGLPQASLQPDVSSQSAEGHVMAAKTRLGGMDLSASTSSITQSALRTRATGFSPDPFAMAFIDQTETLNLLSLSRPLTRGALSLTPELSLGTAKREKGAVAEYSPRGLASRSAAAETLSADVQMLSLTAAVQKPEAGLKASLRVATATSDARVMSAFSVLGLPDLTDARLAPVSKATAVCVAGEKAFANGAVLALSADMGNSDADTRTAARLTLRLPY